MCSLARTGLLGWPSVSRDGTLVYSQDDRKWRLNWIETNGSRSPAPGADARWIQSVALSPDGSTAAIATAGESQGFDIWLHDLLRGTRTRLTTESSAGGPIWHPSGKSIAFRTSRRGNWDILTIPVDGSGQPTELVATPLDEEPMDWSPNGKILLYRVAGNRSDIWRLDTQLSTTAPVPFLQSPRRENFPVLSPDGRFIAYSSNESGRPEVYLQRFPEGGDRRQVSVNGGDCPRWRMDGRELVFIEDQYLVSVPITLGAVVSFGVPRRVASASSLVFPTPDSRLYDISPDGRRILVAELDSETARPVIRVVQNWFAEFKDRK